MSQTTPLAERLHSLGLSASELAEIAKVDPSTPHRWLSGETRPRKRSLDDIADARSVSRIWLATGEGPRESQAAEPDATTYPADDDGPLLGRSVAEAVGDLGTPTPDRYSHLVVAGEAWDYELVDPETGRVRMAVRVQFMRSETPKRSALAVQPASAP